MQDEGAQDGGVQDEGVQDGLECVDAMRCSCVGFATAMRCDTIEVASIVYVNAVIFAWVVWASQNGGSRCSAWQRPLALVSKSLRGVVKIKPGERERDSL